MLVEVRPIMVSDMLGLPRPLNDGGAGPAGATSSVVQVRVCLRCCCGGGVVVVMADHNFSICWVRNEFGMLTAGAGLLQQL